VGVKKIARGHSPPRRGEDSNGTSMISLILPPKDQVSRVAKMLADEYGTASNIKSRVNRLSVLGAITSVQQRLKLYPRGVWPRSVGLPGLTGRRAGGRAGGSARQRSGPVLRHDHDGRGQGEEGQH
jgi:hypothetical protein